MIFTDLKESDRKDLIEYISYQTGYSVNVIEKDWWVTSVLRALFSLPYAEHCSLKGGTSLSKCWHLINRMSEDADIGINREFLGFSGDLSKTQIRDKLRRATCSFVREKMSSDLKEELIKRGISKELFDVKVNISPVTTTDPETIYVYYKSLYEQSEYILPKVKIEISGRSMTEPIAQAQVLSYLNERMTNIPFEESPFILNAVLPERTFLEKLFLLHEEFSKPMENIRVERMSRHLYDINQILKIDIGVNALNDDNLYQSILDHRRKFIGLKGFDYSSLNKHSLKIVPPQGEIREKWRKDYESTLLNMILGESDSFDEIIKKLEELNRSINLNHSK